MLQITIYYFLKNTAICMAIPKLAIYMADLNPNLNPYPHHVRVHVPLIYHRVQLVTHFCMLTEGVENCSMQFKTYRSRYVTRSNTLKIPNSRCHYDLRKYSFSWKLSTSGIVYHL